MNSQQSALPSMDLMGEIQQGLENTAQSVEGTIHSLVKLAEDKKNALKPEKSLDEMMFTFKFQVIQGLFLVAAITFMLFAVSLPPKDDPIKDEVYVPDQVQEHILSHH